MLDSERAKGFQSLTKTFNRSFLSEHTQSLLISKTNNNMINNDFVKHGKIDYKYRFRIPSKYLRQREEKEVLTGFLGLKKMKNYEFNILEIPFDKKLLEDKIKSSESICKDFELDHEGRIILGKNLTEYLNIQENREIGFYMHQTILYLGSIKNIENYSKNKLEETIEKPK